MQNTTFNSLIPTKSAKKAVGTKPATVKASAKKTKASKKAVAPFAPSLSVGQTVIITGHAGGHRLDHSGKIVAFVPAGVNAYDVMSIGHGFDLPNGCKNMSIRFGRAVSRVPRYIVRSNDLNSKNEPKSRIAVFYSPTAQSVERSNAGKVKAAKRQSAKTVPSSATVAIDPVFGP